MHSSARQKGLLEVLVIGLCRIVRIEGCTQMGNQLQKRLAVFAFRWSDAPVEVMA